MQVWSDLHGTTQRGTSPITPARKDAGPTQPARPSADAGTLTHRDEAERPDEAPFDAGADPERNAVDVGSICDRLATLQCAAEAACCDAPGRTQAECKQAMKARCDMDAMADAVAARSEAALSRRGSTCKPRKSDGSPCTLTTECESLLCEDGECVAADAQLAYCLREGS